jgi:predicted enzyme related to lactoylglutathione lyase
MLRRGSRDHELIFAKITVADLGRALDFYIDVVGLKPTEPEALAAARASTADFVEVSLNPSGSLRDPSLVLVRRKGDLPRRESARLTWIAFKVADVAASLDRVRSAGCEIRDEATAYQGAVFGIAYDLDGYTLEFLQAEPAD